jgi:dolichyl-phosphate beta-glucosyltransferase
MVELSVVIPAYNAAVQLPPTLHRIIAYLTARGLGFELIVVDDGSTDTTADVSARQLRELGDRGCVIRCDRNRGKGAAVQRGMLTARGARVLFTDADLSTPIEEVEKLERVLGQGTPIAIGSRALDRSLIERHQPAWRDLSGRLFNLVARAVALPGIWDTQCGFKLFELETIRPVFGRQRIVGFAFDVEILVIARRLGLPVAEVPVRWTDCADTRVTLRAGARALLDLVSVRANVWRGRYEGVTGAALRGASRSDPLRVRRTSEREKGEDGGSSESAGHPR